MEKSEKRGVDLSTWHTSPPNSRTGASDPQHAGSISLQRCGALGGPCPTTLWHTRAAQASAGQLVYGLAILPQNDVPLCVHGVVAPLPHATARGSQPITQFPVLSQGHPECLLPQSVPPAAACLESGGHHSCHGLCLFSAPLASLSLPVLHSWTLPAHPGAEWLHPKLCVQSPLPFHRPQFSPDTPKLLHTLQDLLYPMPSLTHWLCRVGYHPHTEPGPAQGPARLEGSPLGTPGRVEGGPRHPHPIAAQLTKQPLHPHMSLGEGVSAAICGHPLRCLVVGTRCHHPAHLGPRRQSLDFAAGCQYGGYF